MCTVPVSPLATRVWLFASGVSYVMMKGGFRSWVKKLRCDVAAQSFGAHSPSHVSDTFQPVPNPNAPSRGASKLPGMNSDATHPAGTTATLMSRLGTDAA